MLQIWLRFKRWMRSLLLAIAMHAPIDWQKKIDELLDIANDALHKQGVPPGPPMPETPKEPETEPERRRRRRRFG